MSTALLTSKVRIPPPAALVVRRARLVDVLEREAPRRKLTLLSAPAGYGKTTLLAQWARAASMPVAWLALEQVDNDPERLMRYLLAAWETVEPGIRASPLGLLLSGARPDLDAVLAAFSNVASGQPQQLCFVLDDAHVLDDVNVQKALTFLLDHLPPTSHFVLAGRAQPSLPLARYRARQEVFELPEEQLLFGLDETRALLNEMLGLELATDEIVLLHAQLEGWVAGLQLAALTIGRRGDLRSTLPVSGQHRHIADYLSAEVLAALPDDVRRFLVQTSILERLSGPLCDAVSARDNSQELLEALERDNLFLRPLDDRREWYRYHRLFADFLQAELRRHHPDDVADAQRRAARWHLEHDLPEPAFQHAVASEDAALTADIVTRHAYPKLFAGELRGVQRWLDALPPAWRMAHPAFDVARVAYLMFAGEFEPAARQLAELEQRLAHDAGEEGRRCRAQTTAIRCFIACFQNDMAQAQAYGDAALQSLSPEDGFFRHGVCGALGDTYRRNGQWETAHVWYLKLHDEFLGHPEPVEAVHLWGALADLELRQGHLRAATDLWRKALAAIHERSTWGRVPLPLIGWVYLRMGEILYERNDLARARDYLASGFERVELGGDMSALLAGHVLTARLQLTDGELEAAAERLALAGPLAQQDALPGWSSRYERFQLELWLAQGNRRAAIAWSEQLLHDPAAPERPEREAAQLGAVRALIVNGDAATVQHALAPLAHLLRTATAAGRVGVVIEALALQALAHWQRGERPQALTALERALRLAEPEGYLRLFADLGLPMARLLQEAQARAVLPEYVATLLAACDAALAVRRRRRRLAGAPERARTRSAGPGCRRADQPRDRRKAVHLHGDGQETHQ